MELPISVFSGKVGPKKAEGDNQVPEGFYKINNQNYNSNYFLSKQISYPNSYDAAKRYTGGQIMIHGQDASVGCLAMGGANDNGNIKKSFVAFVMARNNGQALNDLHVHGFPVPLTNSNFNTLTSRVNNTDLSNFWTNLKQGYDYFETNRKLANITITGTGSATRYVVN